MDMPVLVITGHGTREMELELMCKGCRGYLEKPIDDEDLVERVSVLLKRKGKYINNWR
jgi:FixJ family two-component response regulator